MTVFAVVYFGTALAVTAAVYFMSLNSEKKPALKTVLLIDSIYFSSCGARLCDRLP